MTELWNLILPLLGVVVSGLLALISTGTNVGEWIVGQLLYVIEALFTWGASQLNPAWAAHFEQDPIAPVIQFVDAVAWYVPMHFMLAVVASTYAMVAGIQLVRWTLAMIPGIG